MFIEIGLIILGIFLLLLSTITAALAVFGGNNVWLPVVCFIGSMASFVYVGIRIFR
jgi:hypothetical protein